MPLEFGVFDHIEPVPGLSLRDIYRLRLQQLERLDAAGFYAYHLAEHHTPAVHSLAPSQNVFLAAAAQRTQRIRLGPCIYVLPLHHPLRLIEEICMLDNLSDGRMEIGVGRGGVLEAHFWGQDSDVETNFARYRETLDIIQQGLSHPELNYDGEFYQYDHLPMRLQPQQQPYPPFWYMRNVETAAIAGMNTIIVGSLDSFEANVKRYHEVWDEHQGVGALTLQGTQPKISLVNHLVIAETDEEALAIGTRAWEHYVWNLGTPRRLEAESRGLTQFLIPNDQMRPKSAPEREARRDLYWSLEQLSEERQKRRQTPGGLGGVANQGAGFGVIAGSPASIRAYLDEYLETGANYFVCGFQWGDLTHQQAMQSIELFAQEIMPHYAAAPDSTPVG
jgi:alkanesulfonate monooxygenase SsuD/methylene tetrahydromethanopterin reductase-like flavin-dependent oxidoreductase (luciferase family)